MTLTVWEEAAKASASGGESQAGLLVVLAAAGFLGGVINTIAGGGSFLTMPLLLWLGLPPGVANGTIRVGIFLQNVVATATFYRRGVRHLDVVAKMSIPTCLGGVLGAWLVNRLQNELLRDVFGVALIVWAIVLVVKPGRFLHQPDKPKDPGFGTLLLVGLITTYGGFLQAGVGFPLMALLVLGLGYDPVRANAVKVSVVMVFTALALPVFASHGNIAWREAAVLAVGTMTGGWVGTRWQLKAGATLVRWVVVAMVLVSGVLILIT